MFCGCFGGVFFDVLRMFLLVFGYFWWFWVFLCVFGIFGWFWFFGVLGISGYAMVFLVFRGDVWRVFLGVLGVFLVFFGIFWCFLGDFR